MPNKAEKNKKAKRIFSSLWFRGIATTAIGSIIAYLVIFTTVGKFIVDLLIQIKNSVFKFFSISFSIPLWIFILLLIPATIFVIIIIGLLIGKKKSSPYFSSYIKDEVEGVVWEWSWEYKKLSRKHNIEDLFPFCPKCDCQLSNMPFGGYNCPNCSFKKFSYPKSDVEVRMIINQRLNRMLSQNQNKG